MEDCKKKRTYLILTAVFLLACFLRLWGIHFGLPQTQCRPDESIIADEAMGFFSGDFNPHYFNYGTFYQYVIFFLYWVYFKLGVICHNFASFSDFRNIFSTEPSVFYLIIRYVTVFMGVFTVFTVYKIAREIGSRTFALLSASFLTIAFLHVRDSHFGTVDVPATFLLTVAVYFIVRAYIYRSIWYYIFAGIFTGLGASTKYAASFLIVPMIFISCYCEGERAKHFLSVFFNKKFISFLAASVICFFVGTPYALLDFSKFIADVAYEAKLFQVGTGMALERGWFYHLRFTLWYGLGWSLFLAGVIGMALMFFKNYKKAFVLFLFPLVYYFVAGSGYKVCVRYMIPMVPFLCLAAAACTEWVISKIYVLTQSILLRSLCVAILIFVLVFPSLDSVIKFDSIISRKDTRLLASEWISSNVQSKDAIYQSSEEFSQIQPATKWVFDSRRKIFIFCRSLDISRPGAVGKPAKTVADSTREGGFPQYLVLIDSPVKEFTAISNDLALIAKTRYSLVKSLRSMNSQDNRAIFDPYDAFYVPFHGFEGACMPGPNIFIYRILIDQKVQEER